MQEPSPVQRLLGLAAASLMLTSLLTGLYAAAAMTGKIHVDGHNALAAHLTALMCTFLIGTVGWTMPMLRYAETGKRRLALVFIVSSFAAWGITAIKAAFFVEGIDVQGKLANDIVFGVLQVLVVLPMLGASVVWVLGFRAKAS
jgi:(hydroxyamino)benzene mutase